MPGEEKDYQNTMPFQKNTILGVIDIRSLIALVFWNDTASALLISNLLQRFDNA